MRSSGWTNITSTVSAWTRSRRCFISIIRASPGNGFRMFMAAVKIWMRSFFEAFQRSLLRALPGNHDHRRGIDRVAGRVASDLFGRPRLWFQMEHGLDARLPAIHESRSDLPEVSPRQH